MKLIKVVPSHRVQGRWLVHLEGEELLRVEEGTVVELGLRPGLELTEEQEAALRQASERDALREKALSLLSRRSYSRQELLDKLTARKKGEGELPPGRREAAEAVAGRLTELGLLDDGAYALAVARHCAAKGYGPGRVRQELYRRKVPREYWEEALAQGEEEDAAPLLDAFVAKKLRGEVPDRAALKRVSDALARRGYRWEDISAALARYRAQFEEV